jgi:hypothetical protein
MANQAINLGIGTTGADTLYNGAVKINSNFLEIYSTFGNGVNIVSYANTSGIATTASSLSPTANINTTGIITAAKLVVNDGGTFTGVVTATSFSGPGTNLSGIVTSIIAGTGVTVSGSTGQVTINTNQQYYRLNSNYVGNTGTTAQPILGVGVALTSSTTYEFELGFTIQKTSGGTSHNFQFNFGGTYTDGGTSAAANSYMQMSYVVLDGATAVGSTSNLWSTNSIGGAYNIFTASTVANRLLHMNVRGTISVGSTGGGTFIPQYTLTANPGAAYSTRTGSWMKISPLGAAGSNISIGNWA